MKLFRKNVKKAYKPPLLNRFSVLMMKVVIGLFLLFLLPIILWIL